MIAVPFIYFSLLAYFFFMKSKRIDLAVYISLIYASSGMFSIMIDIFSLRSYDTAHYQISILATIVYCFMFTLCLLPISAFSRAYYGRIVPLKSDSALKIIARFGFIFAAFSIFMSFGSLRTVLNSDMGVLRNDLYQGLEQEGWMSALPTIIRTPIALLNHFFGAPWVFIFLAFYALFVQRMPKKYGIMFLFVSLLGPINGIIGVDRSNVTYWMLSLIGCYLFFRSYIPKTDRKKYFLVVTLLLGVFILYLFLLTNARFEDIATTKELSGGQGSVVGYLGQPFINFCYFYDNFESPVYNPGILFPFISKTIFGGFSGTVEWQAHLTIITHTELGVFYTFLGAIKIGLGKIGMYAYLFIITIGGYNMVRIRGGRPITLHKSFVYFLLASIPMLGIFGHFYSSATKTFCITAFFFFTYVLSNRTHR